MSCKIMLEKVRQETFLQEKMVNSYSIVHEKVLQDLQLVYAIFWVVHRSIRLKRNANDSIVKSQCFWPRQ